MTGVTMQYSIKSGASLTYRKTKTSIQNSQAYTINTNTNVFSTGYTECHREQSSSDRQYSMGSQQLPDRVKSHTLVRKLVVTGPNRLAKEIDKVILQARKVIPRILKKWKINTIKKWLQISVLILEILTKTQLNQ